MTKILYFDTETTGIDPTRHEIIQLSAIIEIDGVVKEEINLEIRPEKWDTIDPQALAVTGITIDKLKSYKRSQEAAAIWFGFTLGRYVNRFDKKDKFYPAGHNVQFDLDFLQPFMKRKDIYGSGIYQNWRSIDTRVLANFMIAEGKLPDLPDVKLSTLCDHYKIPIQAHDAMSDIRATRELLQKMRSDLCATTQDLPF